ncbi:MAG: type III secretion system stalk subunit SctO [Janthinobacterium lividum]
MEVIDDLLRIKKFREQKAELALAKARGAVAQALAALEKARADLAECEASCDRRQRALYADLLSRLVLRAEIDAVMVDVEEMKREIQAAEEVVEKKKVARDEAEKKLEAARVHHHEAMRGREKFTELSSLAGLERLALEQRKEDHELEEAKGAAPAGSDRGNTQDSDVFNADLGESA